MRLAFLSLAALLLTCCDDAPPPAASVPKPAPAQAKKPAGTIPPITIAGPRESAFSSPSSSPASDGDVQRELAALRAEVMALKEKVARLERGSPSAPALPKYLPNTTGVPGTYTVPPAVLNLPSDDFPKRGAALSKPQFAELLSGNVRFNPGPIPSSDRLVTPTTPLHVGQEVQLKWGTTWWAATVTGFEPDGTVRASYFGWDRTFDEAVPRTDLQLDTNTREKAIQSSYLYQP